MPNDSPKTDPFARISMRFTPGEVLPDGTLIEPIDVDGTLKLLHSNGIQNDVVPQFDYGSTIFSPPQLSPTLRNAVRFPTPPIEFGSVPVLGDQTVGVFEGRGLTRNFSSCCASMVLASWVPEAFFSPPTFLISCGSLREVAILSTLLRPLCRRSFLTPKLGRDLPFWIQPTLVVLTDYTSIKEGAFWQTANIPGVRVPSRRGTVDSLACFKILFTTGEQSLASWGPGVLPLRLSSCAMLSFPTEQELSELQHEFQPKLLSWRVARLTQANAAPTPVEKHFPNCDVARQLIALIHGDPQLVATVTPLLDARQQEFDDARQRDPHRAIIESLWKPSHTAKEMTVREIVERTNDILHSRGETIKLHERVVGWKLRSVGLKRVRNGNGMLVVFSADVRRRLHEIARTFELELPTFKGCIHCNRD
jgi:hypothetical protein